MSWETRGNNRYYYRRRKVAGRVIGEYVGAGYLAEVMAAEDEAARQARQAAAAEWRSIVEADRRQEKALADIAALVRAAIAAVLIANGYHTHKRQWRKTR